MTELQAKISDLRTAADQMQQSSLHIDQAVQDVRDTISTLLAAGYQSSASFTVLYNSYYSAMETWSQNVRAFAANLSQTADAVEQAAQAASTFTLAGAWAAAEKSARKHQPTPASAPETPPPPQALGAYMAAINRPLYDQLIQQQDQLTTEQNHLVALLDARRRAIDDVAALQNRLLSYDPNINLNGVPRVQALQSQIALLDQQIAETRGRIDDLQTSIRGLITRLDRVAPGAGANLEMITQLEHSQTAEWIKSHTEGCVNYVVSRLAIPDGLAYDAYLWNDKAAQLTQYGITSGSVPLPGAVIVMEREHSYADDVLGHLMYVEAVDPDGTVWITDNTHSTPVKLSDLTSEVSGPYLTYLYFPWHTHA